MAGRPLAAACSPAGVAVGQDTRPQSVPSMPETPEIDTDRLRETIDAEIEHGAGGRFLRTIALTTALLAALAAVAALKAGATANEALVLKTDAGRLQAEASDQWTYYQAKGIKGAIAQGGGESYRALGRQVPPHFADEAARYALEQRQIKTAAEQKERQRDERSDEADHLLHRHHTFANAVALFQVAIALGAVAALTRSRPVWVGSVLIGASGTVLFAAQFIR
ncbi:MAG: hypothetical protein NVS4B3_05910 [Gemmatimonadaceae bacterium]